MAQQIRTRIQRAIELFRDDDEVYMPALELPALHMGQRRAQHVDTYRVDKQSAFEELVAMSFLPTFVLDEELVQLANQKDYELSLLELKEGGFLQLPFKSAMYEWSGRSTSGKMVHAIVNLIDINHPDTIGQDTLPEHVRAARGWYDCAAHVYKIERDDDGEYVVISPSVLYLGINRHEDGTPWLRMSGEPAWWLDDNHENAELVQFTFRKDAVTAFRAFACAALLTNTQGVAKEVITCGKLNKKRTSSGKLPIPDHTYIYIGRVYKSADSNASVPYVPGKSKKPHWRRAHTRLQRFGPGYKQTRLIKIDAMIVAWDGAGEPPKPKHEYRVKV